MTPRASPEAIALRSSHARAAGAAFEDVLDLQHQVYARRRQAVIHRNFLACKALGGGRFAPVAARTRPDFTGALSPGGQLVCFDAKSTKESWWRLPAAREHQLSEMLELAAVGAWCWFLVEFRVQGVACVLRVTPGVHMMVPEVHVSQVPPFLDLLPLASYAVPGPRLFTFPIINGVCDWLPPILTAWAGRAA
jgi:hypothetical protein